MTNFATWPSLSASAVWSFSEHPKMTCPLKSRNMSPICSAGLLEDPTKTVFMFILCITTQTTYPWLMAPRTRICESLGWVRKPGLREQQMTSVLRYVINSEAQKKLYATMKRRPGTCPDEPRDLGREWHSDSLFETCPSDFSFLRMQATPPAGGDTLWVSGYELYDRLSPPFQRFLETLTAECAQPVFKSACEAGGYQVMSPRGSPLNVDFEFAPHHPVIRTHPVTGWKSVFAGVGLHVSKIDGVWAYEDQMIREYLMRLITRNHDCVARMHWTKGACAIWSNACTLHAATVSP